MKWVEIGTREGEKKGGAPWETTEADITFDLSFGGGGRGERKKKKQKI